MRRSPIFTNVLQVAVIVRDLNAAVRRYADEYGIGPWRIYSSHDRITEMTLRGQPAALAFRWAVCDIGTVNWELIEPLDDRSIFAEFLRDHGEGVQHIAFATDDVPGAIEQVRRRSPDGVGSLLGARWDHDGQTLRAAFLNTTGDLGVVAEVYQRPSTWVRPEPDEIYPPSGE